VTPFCCKVFCIDISGYGNKVDLMMGKNTLYTGVVEVVVVKVAESAAHASAFEVAVMTALSLDRFGVEGGMVTEAVKFVLADGARFTSAVDRTVVHV
jgi:hypothetical protein